MKIVYWATVIIVFILLGIIAINDYKLQIILKTAPVKEAIRKQKFDEEKFKMGNLLCGNNSFTISSTDNCFRVKCHEPNDIVVFGEDCNVQLNASAL